MNERIFITGDKHGAIRPFFGLSENQQLLETDVLLITGDAGYVFHEEYQYNIETLEQLFPGTIAFIDGNHENFDILNAMEEEVWCGGRVHMVSPRVIHLIRGEVYEIYGNTIFVFGGARTTDKFDRESGSGWWQEEEPSQEELDYGKAQLMNHLDQIDYVISHEAPRRVRNFTARKKHVPEDYSLPDILDDWYAEARKGKRFKIWYFGHMHVDQKIAEDLRGLHNEILYLGTEERFKW